MIRDLSPQELRVANEFCKGLTDNEVGDNLFLSPCTVRAHKYRIYQKLGINKEVELFYYMICRKLNVKFDIKEIHKKGLSLFFLVLFLFMQITCVDMDNMRAQRTTRVVRTTMVRGRRAKE